MPNDYPPNSPSRRKAKSLNAQDAEVLIISTLANVRSSLSQKQMNQIQKVLDAAVVNPAVKKEAEELARRSVTHRAGSLVMHDPRIERQIDKTNEGMIWVHEQDKQIRLDYEKLLVANALDPITDNPDEAEYLKKVKNTLEEKGVWLRVGQERVSDPRSFVVWLSLGYDGDEIPAGIGILDREAILGNQLLAANYVKEVIEGKTRKTLESEIYRLGLEIEDGEKEHGRLIRRYNSTYDGRAGIPVPGVPEISDALGGANLPDLSIWRDPRDLLSETWGSFYADKFERAQVFLIAAAYATASAAQSLAVYAAKSSQGAALAANIAKIVTVASSVIVTTVGIAGLLQSLGAGARALATGESTGSLATRVVNAYVGKNAENNHALLRIVGRSSSPKGSMGGGVKPGTSDGLGTGGFTKWP